MPPDAVGAGLTSRMIFVYEDIPGKIVIFPFQRQEHKELEKILEDDLAIIQHEIEGNMQFSKEMLQAYSKWRLTDGDSKRFMGTMLEAYTTRRPIHHLKLSCILSASRSNDKIIKLVDWERAVKIFKETEIKMPRTFEGVGENPDAPAMKRIIESIHSRGKMFFSEIVSLVQYDMTRQRIIDTINMLVDRRKVWKDYESGPKEDFLIHWIYKDEKEETDER